MERMEVCMHMVQVFAWLSCVRAGGRDGKLCVWGVDLRDPDLMGG